MFQKWLKVNTQYRRGVIFYFIMRCSLYPLGWFLLAQSHIWLWYLKAYVKYTIQIFNPHHSTPISADLCIITYMISCDICDMRVCIINLLCNLILLIPKCTIELSFTRNVTQYQLLYIKSDNQPYQAFL